MSGALSIGVIGDFDETFTPHLATNDALEHAAGRLGVRCDVAWLPTLELEDDLSPATAVDALWCAPGAPYRSMAGTLAALQYAREAQVPALGTCGGCQHMIIEFARNVLGIKDADHAEYDPYASVLIISKLACSLVGRTMSVVFDADSLVASLYGATDAREQYYCNFALNSDYRPALEEGGLRVTGNDADGEARVLELPGHPFYLATLFVPQTRSTAEQPHPVVIGFLEAARKRVATTSLAA